MAIGQMLQFPGMNSEKYDAVGQELGWANEKGQPDGLTAHAAGSTDDGFCVMEWWDSQADWDTFLSTRLGPAFEKVGGLPQPQVTHFAVHARYPV